MSTSENLLQIYEANPITVNNPLDLMYFAQYPYGLVNDAAMTFANFNLQIVATGTQNQLGYYATTGNKISPLNASNESVLLSSNTGLPIWSSPLTNGEVIIGSTGETPVAATLTAGSGIEITNAAGSITIASTSSPSLTWLGIPGTTQSAAVATGYVNQNASLTTITLPATCALGDIVAVQGLGASGWALVANSGQTIQVGMTPTSTAGSISSNNQYDSVEVICIVADTLWSVKDSFTNGFVIV